MRRYELHDGRILTWSLEAHAVDHCNLRCAWCCTISPELPPRFVEPAELARDLARARRALAPHVFKITGGEPLLHPDIVGLLEVARSSGVSDRISITTNGFLLPRVPDRFWTLVDGMTLSWYASAPLDGDAVRAVEERCAAHGVALTVKRIDAFQVLDAPRAHDDATAREVHRSCWLRDRCHCIHRGRFYVCTRPPHIEDALARRGEREDLSSRDGVPLDAPDLGRRILAALEASEPLASCRHCLGASGPWEPHRQLRIADPAGPGSGGVAV